MIEFCVEKLDKIFSIRKIVRHLLEKDPAMGFLVQKVDFSYYDTDEDFKKNPDLKSTYASISFENFNYHIHINLDKMINKDREFQIEVLKHEIGHISNGTFFRYQALDINTQAKFDLWNIATDIAINENLPLLHKFGYHAKKLNFPINKTSEFYYKELMKNPPKPLENNIDSHMIKESDEIKEIKQITKKIIKDAIKDAKDHDENCTIPDSFLETLEMIERSSYNWIKEFRSFVGKYLGQSKRRTRSRFNKRYKHFAGSVKKLTKDDIFIIIDTSASVSKEMLQLFFNEIKKIFSLGFNIYIIECDADVQRSYRYYPSTTFSIKGRGGTLYQPAIDFAIKENPAFIVLFGDGGYFDSELKEPDNLLWVLPYGCNARTKNKKIYIGEKQ